MGRACESGEYVSSSSATSQKSKENKIQAVKC